MDPRSGGRPSQVRPRPAPNGRPRRVKARPSEPSPTRLGQHRRLERRRGLPLVAKILLGSSIVVLGAFIVWTGSGGVGPFLASIVRGFGGFVETVGTAVGSPAPTDAPITSDAPAIGTPEQAYVNAKTVDRHGDRPQVDRRPARLHGPALGHACRTRIPRGRRGAGRRHLRARHPGRHARRRVATTSRPRSSGPGGESDRSAVATWVLDTSKPKVRSSSPKNGVVDQPRRPQRSRARPRPAARSA